MAFAVAPVDLPPPSGASRWRRALGPLAVASLLVLALQGWAPQLRSALAPAHRTTVEPPFDTEAVVEREAHSARPVAGTPGRLAVEDPSYRASFDRAGFTYAPTHGASALRVSLTQVERGQRALVAGVSSWQADANVSRRQVGTGLQEEVTARKGAVEWDLVLAGEPAGRGDLVVRARLSGVRQATVEGTATRLELVDGSVVDLGETTVIDAQGGALHRSRPIVRNGVVELRVPGHVLEGASYPITVDPTVTSAARVDRDLPPHQGGTPSVAFDGQHFLVVWHYAGQDGRDEIFATRVNGDGSTVGGSFPVSTSANPKTNPDVAWNGTSFLVVWQYQFTATDLDILARRVSPSGFALGSEIPVERPSGNQVSPTVAAGGSTFYVAWEDERTGAGDIVGKRVSAAGAVLDTESQVVAGDSVEESDPEVAWNGDTFLVAYQFAFGASDPDVYAQLVSPSGVREGSRQVMSNRSGLEGRPSVASDGTGFLVVWQDHRNGSPNVFATRTSSTGTRLDSAGIPVASVNQVNDGAPAVIFNGVYLVVWLRNSFTIVEPDVYGARVRTDGTVVEPNGFEIDGRRSTSTQVVAAAPAAGGEKWTVVQEFGGAEHGVEFQLVSSK
jgi:hypothetical protein